MHFENGAAHGGCGCGGRGSGHGRGRGHGMGGGCAMPAFDAVEGRLSAEAHEAVLEALDDEYRARAFYLAVLERFPGAMPFAHIVESEERHAAALARVLAAYGLAVPPNPYIGNEAISRSVPGSIACACDLAVKEEVHNDRLYEEKLLPKAEAFPLVAQVFERLMLASRERHLPAFRRFAEAYRAGRRPERAH
ncbi:hypothetical protein K9U39_00125 [Rhodoblastus acidophilus]|uniref:DUF2202 domain-containing protein n=1 Tax=Candidatus Rhodoblastus alkanivorans TaxID=2954117 RepID=A0ABS9Z3P3_9HYPH|nr:hypothetical protein [Candidatus Rhodoblastus alkanivorans]MCI4677330.1 hypothetical protein [Candidatus Rhodoblastus alkanivorans]MCI4682065.1 hypothetical protein [Candidatus Rhodoblastus alkanivorans]MDI4639367.1 hypothetical protein [Rhodoblastus acidophilus]